MKDLQTLIRYLEDERKKINPNYGNEDRQELIQILMELTQEQIPNDIQSSPSP